jgi:hypothetical protein
MLAAGSTLPSLTEVVICVLLAVIIVIPFCYFFYVPDLTGNLYTRPFLFIVIISMVAMIIFHIRDGLKSLTKK